MPLTKNEIRMRLHDRFKQHGGRTIRLFSQLGSVAAQIYDVPDLNRARLEKTYDLLAQSRQPQVTLGGIPAATRFKYLIR